MATIEFRCPSCQAATKAPESAAGKKARCPKCGCRCTVPDPYSSNQPFDFERHAEFERTNEDVEYTIARRKRRSVSLIAFFLAIAAMCVGGGGWLMSTKSKGNQSEIDRDYLDILLLKYEEVAVLSYKQWWLSDSEKIPCFSSKNEEKMENHTAALRSCILASDICQESIQRIQSQELSSRKSFVEKHRKDYSSYTETFRLRHPQRDLIFDEIKEWVPEYARSPAIKWSSYLIEENAKLSRKATDFEHGTRSVEEVKKSIELADKTYWGLRTQLIEREVPKVIKEIIDKTKNMSSIQLLRTELN